MYEAKSLHKTRSAEICIIIITGTDYCYVSTAYMCVCVEMVDVMAVPVYNAGGGAGKCCLRFLCKSLRSGGCVCVEMVVDVMVVPVYAGGGGGSIFVQEAAFDFCATNEQNTCKLDHTVGLGRVRKFPKGPD